MRDVCPCCKLGDYKVISSHSYEQKELYIVHFYCTCKICQTEFILSRYYRLEKEEVSAS